MGIRSRVGLLLGLCALLLAASLTDAAAEEILRWEPGTVEWDAVGMAPRGRAVEIEFRPNSCETKRNEHVVVQESRMQVRITLQDEVAVYPPGSGIRSCPPGHDTPMTVSLARPLAGRRIYGRARTNFPLYRQSAAPVSVPGMAGFSPWDAKHALFLQRLRGESVHGRGRHLTGLRRVIRQTPPAGQKLPVGGVVGLTIVR